MHEAGVCTEELPNSPTKEGASVSSILLQFSIWETHFIFMYLYMFISILHQCCQCFYKCVKLETHKTI